jgi:hypothetical protein
LANQKRFAEAEGYRFAVTFKDVESLTDEDLAVIRAQIEMFDNIDEVDEEIREVIKGHWPDLLNKRRRALRSTKIRHIPLSKGIARRCGRRSWRL